MSLFTPRKSTEFIAIHCSATKATMDVGVEDIRKWHRREGYVDVGYHFVIRRNGVVEAGRPVNVIGGHVKNYNANSIGICMVGGVAADGKKAENNFTPEQFAALTKLLADLRKDYPKAVIQGHRDFPAVKKDCPSFDVRAWLKTVNLK